MTKEEFTKVVTEAAGDSAYGKALVEDLVEHYGETGKYAQNAKDRLDEHLGSLKGWEKKHAANGDTAAAEAEAAKIAVVENVLKAIA